MAAYYVPNCNVFEREVELRVKDAIKNKVEGAIIHMNRSCKNGAVTCMNWNASCASRPVSPP